MPKKCLICSEVAECVSGTPQKQEKTPVPAAKKKKGPPECSHQLGYLRSLPDGEAVPSECEKCQALLECRNLI